MNLKQKFKLKLLKINSFFILAVGFYVRVRGGFAQIWCSDPFKPMVISGLRRNFGLRLPFPVLLSSFSVPRSLFPVLRSSFSVPRSLFIIFRFLFSVPRSSFSVLRSPFSVLRSPFSVLRSPFPALSLPFPVPRSSIIVARSSFLVGVTSYYCYGAIVVSSNSDFWNILVPWALF